MSLATTQTPGQHGATAHSDGGWGAAAVPVQTRSERFSSTDPAAFPPVTGLEIDWRLSPVETIRALIDGSLDGSPYDASADDAVSWIPMSDPRVGSAGVPEDRAAANAWSSTERALSIDVVGDAAREVRVDRAGFGTDARAAHTVITARSGSTGHVVLRSTGPARLVENVEIVVEDGASLTVVSIQEWDDESLHLASHFAQVGRDAHLTHVVVTLGGRVVRLNPSVHLSGEGAQGDLYGLYFADGGQHLEQRVYLHHQAPHTRGEVTYKGALQGTGARTVWVGDVLIGPDATGTDSYEQNRNLVLTEGTRADSIPNLEIQTGDIVGAGHASATGRFDDEQLFYLQARGIPEDEARRLVVVGFLAEIVQKIGSPALEEEILDRVVAELGGAA